MLPDAAVKEFVEIYEKEFGIKLKNDDAKLIAEKVFSLFKALIKKAEMERKEVIENGNKNESKGTN